MTSQQDGVFDAIESGSEKVSETRTRPAQPFSSASIAHRIGDLILDKKGQNLVVIDVEKVTTLADFFIIVTAANRRQAQALAEEIRIFAKAEKVHFIGQEGGKDGEWVLIDFGDCVVHIMLEEARGFYGLETMWADGEVVRRSDDLAEYADEVAEDQDADADADDGDEL